MTGQIEEQGVVSTEYVTKKSTPVIIQTSSHRLHGNIHIGLGKRLKDELDGCLQFIPVTNVTVFDDQGQVQYHSHFMLVNREQLIWVVPEEDMINDEEPFGV